MYKLLSSLGGCLLILFTIRLEGCHRAVPPDSFWNGFDQGYPAGRLVSATRTLRLLYGNSEGYYKEEGLDVSIQPGGPFAVAAKQVAAGVAEFGTGSSDGILEEIADGQPLIVVAATMQRDRKASWCGATHPSTLSSISMDTPSR